MHSHNGISGIASPKAFELSERERQLIALSAEGNTDVEIANQLCISTATVNVYWTRLRAKLGAKSRTEAVAVALRSHAETEHRRLEQRYRSAQPADGNALSETIRALVDHAPDGILLADRDGKITYVNPALARIFGYTPAELAGAHLSILVPERSRETHVAQVQEFGSHPAERRMGHGLFVAGVKKDGTEIAVCVTLSGMQHGPDTTSIAIVRDYTRELEMIRRLEARTEAGDGHESPGLHPNALGN